MKSQAHFRLGIGVVLLAALVLVAGVWTAQSDNPTLRFEVSFPQTLRGEPLTGRLFVCLSPTSDPEPRIAAYGSARARTGKVPFFAVDVEQLRPGQAGVVDMNSIGFPYEIVKDLPPGEYYVQGVVNVYTQFKRSDGHTVWAHMDQWEGQRWAYAPGNLISEPQKVRIDPKKGGTVRISLTKVIPPIEVPKDTKWVKRIKIQSKLLTEFWGRPIYLGAVVLLPKGYDEHPDVRYPVVYFQNHFSLDPAFGFTAEKPVEDPTENLFREMRRQAAGKRESGFEFYQSWNSDNFPRMIAVTFQHPTPYFDDSYAVNSANNGPYGDAILKELIPYVEEHFRIIQKPHARVLTGGSTGGWESLALQLYHPDFFGGTWTMFPDPIDFRKYLLINIYEDENAFIVPGSSYGWPERMFQRWTDGQPVASVRYISQMELASGTRGRSAAQIDIWNATYGPVGKDGYPRQLWDLKTGKIDREVASYMRDNGYDLRDYAEKNWSKIGPKLVGKIRIYNPEMDHFYLPYAVYLMEEFLEKTKNPYYAGEIIHGRPMKGHGWQPMTNAELIRMMADHITKNSPRGEDTANWKY